MSHPRRWSDSGGQRGSHGQKQKQQGAKRFSFEESMLQGPGGRGGRPDEEFSHSSYRRASPKNMDSLQSTAKDFMGHNSMHPLSCYQRGDFDASWDSLPLHLREAKIQKRVKGLEDRESADFRSLVGEVPAGARHGSKESAAERRASGHGHHPKEQQLLAIAGELRADRQSASLASTAMSSAYTEATEELPPERRRRSIQEVELMASQLALLKDRKDAQQELADLHASEVEPIESSRRFIGKGVLKAKSLQSFISTSQRVLRPHLFGDQSIHVEQTAYVPRRLVHVGCAVFLLWVLLMTLLMAIEALRFFTITAKDMHVLAAEHSLSDIEAGVVEVFAPAVAAARVVVLAGKAGLLGSPRSAAEVHNTLEHVLSPALRAAPYLHYVKIVGASYNATMVEFVSTASTGEIPVAAGGTCNPLEPVGCFRLPNTQEPADVAGSHSYWVGPRHADVSDGSSNGTAWVLHLVVHANVTADVQGRAPGLLSVEVALSLQGAADALAHALRDGSAAFVALQDGQLLAGSDWAPTASNATVKAWEMGASWAEAVLPEMFARHSTSEVWREQDLVMLRPLPAIGVGNVGTPDSGPPSVRAAVHLPRALVVPFSLDALAACMLVLAALPYLAMAMALQALLCSCLWDRCGRR